MRVALLNMPFASLATPSIAITQLESVLKQKLPDQTSVNNIYLNIDFAQFIDDFGLYSHPRSSYGFMSGVGNWFFSASAFPDAPDNGKEYLGRFYFEDDPETQRIRTFLQDKRKDVDGFLDSMIDKYNLLDFDIVGFTLFFAQTTASLAMARRLKTRKPDITTVIGGAACEGTVGWELAKNIDYIDYVFSGPALISFPQVVQNFIDGTTEKNDKINGVFSASSPEPTPETIIGDDLDINTCIELDYGPFLDTLENAYSNTIKPVLIFETSRGCWWAEKLTCSFCGLNGLSTCCRALDPDNAVKHIEAMFSYAPRATTFQSVDNIVPHGYIEDVFPKLVPPENAAIHYETRPNLSCDNMEVLCKAGVTEIQPGIEALSTETLKLMRKGTTAFRNIQLLKDCSRYPLTVEWNLLVYSPGEKEETFEKYLQLIPLLSHLPPPAAAFPILFVRHSRYFNNPEEFGLNLQPQDYYRMTYPFDDNTISRMASLFKDLNSDADKINDWVERLNIKITTWHTRWFNKDSRDPARLCFTDESRSTIYDSRSSEVIEHQLSENVSQLLEFLENPADAVNIQKTLGHLDNFIAEDEIAWAAEKGLLFEEKGQYLSLVTAR